MAEPLVLVAASGLAREVLATARTHGSFDVVGFLDDDPVRAGTVVDGAPVLGVVDAVAQYPGARLLVCAGRGSDRERIVARLVALGVRPERYATVMHPAVEVPVGCAVGAGSILLAGVVLTADVTVGAHVVLMPHVTLTHDDVVEDYATLCSGVTLGGGVVVGRGAYLGMGAAVREHVAVGAGTVVGMGAVLTKHLPEGETYAGRSAREPEVTA